MERPDSSATPSHTHATRHVVDSTADRSIRPGREGLHTTNWCGPRSPLRGKSCCSMPFPLPRWCRWRGGHRDTIIQVKAIALWSVLQHSRAMVVVVVVLYDEGCLTAVTSMNSSRGRVPDLLTQHDGHHHAGRGGECAKWCLVCSLRDRTTAVGAKGLGWAIGSLCVPPLPPGRCQLLRVVGFSPIFA